MPLTSTLARSVAELLERGDPEAFQPVAVEARSGPHVTLHAGAELTDRYWTTTSRASLKARVLRTRPRLATVLRDGDRHRLVGGPTTVLDPEQPFDALADPVGALTSGFAVARLGLGQLDQLLGYVEAAGRIPDGWRPRQRVLLATRLRDVLVLEGVEVVDARGVWERPAVALPNGGAEPETPDLSAVPADAASLAATAAPAWLGLLDEHGPFVVPAAWDPAGWVAVPTAAIDRRVEALDGPVCLTLDESSSRRPDRKRGLMLRGHSAVVDVDGPVTVLALRPGRITFWHGFDADTVALAAA